jgi:hypothetical protein
MRDLERAERAGAASSLERGLDLDGSAAGAIKLTGDLVEDGTKMSLAVTGHYSVQIRGSLR